MPSHKKIRIICLGGIGEIGKNCYVIEYSDSAIIIDCGLSFPDVHLLGVDLVIPDFTYLLRNRGKIKAVLLTHGHEDHIGALPYLLHDFIPPVIYGTPITLGLAKDRVEEMQIPGDMPFETIKAGDTIKINDNFLVDTFHISHSIPDELAFGIRTPIGKLLVSGDFKIDKNPVDGKPTEIEKIREFSGEEGLLAALVDTTNIERAGWTGSESEVGPALRQYFAEHKGRIIVTTFASNIHRIQQVLDNAKATDRRVFLTGRAMLSNFALAKDLGYIKVPAGVLVEPYQLDRVDRASLVVLATGSQGEPMSALSQMSRDAHRFINIGEGDLVLFSASPIPGNEFYIYSVIDNLFRLNAEVIYGRESKVHVSGHGSQNEIEELLRATRPKYLIPVHSQFRHQMLFKKLATSWGFKSENIVIMGIGDVLELDENAWEIRERVKAGAVYIDGISVTGLSTRILNERQLLSEDGILVFTLVLDLTGDYIIQGPILKARGFPSETDIPEFYRELKDLITETLFHNRLRSVEHQAQLRNNISNAIQRFISEKLGLNPVILGTILHLEAENIPQRPKSFQKEDGK